jgi:peptidase E
MSYRIKHFFELSEISINYITTINDEFTKNKKTDLEKFNLLDLQLNYHIFSYTQIIFLINKQLLLEHHKGENIIAAFKTGNLGYVNELGNKFKHSKRMFIYNYTVDGQPIKHNHLNP